MNSQTARKPDDKRPARSNKPNKYVKQTARFDARRDGKPLIFGWGGHLSHKEKVQFQRRVTWAIAALIGLLIVVSWGIPAVLARWQPVRAALPWLAGSACIWARATAC